MNPRSHRLLRLRWAELSDPSPGTPTTRLDPLFPRGTPRFLGRVVTAGSIPSTTDRVYLVNPVRLEGAEAEGASPGLIVDHDRRIPVVVIGSRPPAAGDLLIAQAIAGRWVAESGGAPTLREECWPCDLPAKNLTLSWTNPFDGDGTATLFYNPPARWVTDCFGNYLFSIQCRNGSIEFSAGYFLAGDCPEGQRQWCTSTGRAPLRLLEEVVSCSPLILRYLVIPGECPVISSGGFTSFTVTE